MVRNGTREVNGDQFMKKLVKSYYGLRLYLEKNRVTGNGFKIEGG